MAGSVEDFQKLREGSKMMTRAFIVVLVLAAGLWWQFIRLPQQVEITKMVPGLSGGMTDLECWVTLEFKGEPGGGSGRPGAGIRGGGHRGGRAAFRLGLHLHTRLHRPRKAIRQHGHPYTRHPAIGRGCVEGQLPAAGEALCGRRFVQHALGGHCLLGGGPSRIRLRRASDTRIRA